ncbi:hypothetical protein [Mycoplasmopsis cynos]|nr:hypothetical protein [Mycoplasmopsis cynos]UWV81494.1 hypothetical protein NW065_06250 [Mycoplasmopsis cynos]
MTLIKKPQKFLTDKVTSIEVAIQQANYIIAQWISQDIEIREEIKKRILLQGLIYTKVKKTT